MKPLRDYQMIRLLASFNQQQGKRNISTIDIVDHQQLIKFSNNDGFHQDDDDDDRSCFVSKGDDHFDDDRATRTAENDDETEKCRRIFWESQQFLLQEILDHCNSSGTKLRDQIKRNIARDDVSNLCNCLLLMDHKNLRGSCIKCLRRAVINQLCTKGFNAALCTSNWRKTHKIPGGSHQYIEVIASTKVRTKHIPFVVELGFRDEFKMAKACDEYDKLIDQLPEIYIGKTEHLNAIIRVVCEAAKKSAKEKKIHMGPWRKREFMELKWSASSESKCIGNSSRKGSLSAVRSSFELTMASTVRVA